MPGTDSLGRSIGRVLVAAMAGAALGAGCLTIAYTRHPAFIADMDRDLPRRVGSGFFPAERSGDTTFAWTARRAEVRLGGLKRGGAWVCSVTLRGGRSDPSTQPVVELAVDGITGATVVATNDYQETEVIAWPRPSRDGLILTITASGTIVPGPADPRELGVQVDRLGCKPGETRLIVPPLESLQNAALSIAAFSACFAVVGLGVGGIAVGTLLVAALQALPLSAGAAPYIGFAGTMTAYAVWLAALMAAAIYAVERWQRAPLQDAARFVLLFSGAALYVKLLGLLHPSKLLVDAVFHAHRFEAVLAGQYYFTQPMPGGVSFPYAIGLYLFAAPWAALTRDHVTLLRVVVCAAEIAAGALLYPAIARAWGDRKAAAIAVVLFNVVPLPYGLVGNANLTNAFGQSVGLATLLVATLLPTAHRNVGAVIGLFSLCALAFLSHVSTLALLSVTLIALVFFFRWRGGPALSRPAWTILAVTVAAALFAVVVYYGHFGEVYRTALRVRTASAFTEAPTLATQNAPSTGRFPLPMQRRVLEALAFTVPAVGWPILMLSLVGVWRVWAAGMRDRAVFAIASWGVASGIFLGVAVMRVDAPFQRYAAEFFGRVILATYPAAVMLAACGASWAWRGGAATRVASLVLLLSAFRVGVQHWQGWFQ